MPVQDEIQFFSLDDEQGVQALDGVRMRAVFGQGAMINLVELAPDAVVPLHSHPQEQIGMVISGVQILEVAGVEHRLGPREAYVLPGGVEHAGRGGPDGCLVIDVFCPVREDYRGAAATAIANGAHGA